MKRIINISAVVALVLAAVSCSSSNRYETVKGDALGTKIYTLDNGLKLYMSVNKETPRIQTYIAVKVGSKNDPSETTGLAHYFEHLMFKGTEQFGTSDYAAEKPLLDQIEVLFETYRQTSDEEERKAVYRRIDSISYKASEIAIPNEYDKLMALIGADGTNAWTSSDETVYMEDIPSNQIDNWARIQADRFRNTVIRGFHTELETIYEEKNMSLTKDDRKVWEALSQALYPHHPYGQQTTLGSQEHLKNPSITNVRKYHDDYYVPNNIAICVSGDFDPDEMVAAVQRHFGDWEPNPDIPVLQFEAEKPIVSPVVKNVYGLEAERLAIGWRLPAAADLKNSAIAEIAGAILSNGQAGIIDIDVNQQQKALGLYAFYESLPDYCNFVTMGTPKPGQSLEELRDLALTEVARLRSGDFDESLIASTLNNLKLMKMRALESNSSRARAYVEAFINGISWEDASREMERLESVTKEDVVSWANEFLGPESYAVVYKRMGEDKSVQKISAPEITPIATNRDSQSDFLKSIQAASVTPVEPVFVDFEKEMSCSELSKGARLLYKENTLNDIFTLNFIFNYGLTDDPELSLACDYVSYLGTPDMSAEEFAQKMYGLACDVRFSAGAYQSYVSISGLSENMPEAIRLVENLIFNAEADDNVLASLKANTLKGRDDAKKSQRYCYSALSTYVVRGPEYIQAVTLSDGQIGSAESGNLLSKVRDLYSKGHEILYFGPMKERELKAALLECHAVSGDAVMLPERHADLLQTPASQVVISPYDAKQLYYLQYSNHGESFDASSEAVIDLYNEYFGAGMNTIVFQEMREARGLAYTAMASLVKPSYKDAPYCYQAFIATQNDKMRQAIEAFDDIINNMPRSDASFAVAKDALIGRMRTQRTVGMGVLWSYVNCRRLGLVKPLDEDVFHKVQEFELSDVAEAQKKWVKDRTYTYAILGDPAALDTEYLRTLGPVKVVSSEEIFGY